ncbi:hypothetical protein BLNAU_21748 [Blattamonas nauphoetae]|uniref:Uncharacterized protein n=1 Tax=Blattamonas nauphoetae TaxID=2049346 RepID=A0ABQ9WVH9_9EUKA|nr:hypothetical protein BLNAU_21748 [Blattamonas nauphoetae]
MVSSASLNGSCPLPPPLLLRLAIRCDGLKTDLWLTSNESFVLSWPCCVEVSDEEMDTAVTVFYPLQTVIGLKIHIYRQANNARQRVHDDAEAMTARTSATAHPSLTVTDFEDHKGEVNNEGSGTIKLGLGEDEKLIG